MGIVGEMLRNLLEGSQMAVVGRILGLQKENLLAGLVDIVDFLAVLGIADHPLVCV